MIEIIRIFGAFLLSFLITRLLLPRLSRIASAIGLLDQPSERKVHGNPKPLVGGVGMAMGLSVACMLFVPLANLRGYFAGALLLVLIGFLDDFRELIPRWKFIVQLLAVGAMMLLSGTVLLTFGNLLGIGEISFQTLAIPMTILGAVGVINAVNMIDGLDGLAGGVSLIAFAAIAILAYMDGQKAHMLLSLALCGSVLAFLWFNWRPASLFMGDAGSLLLGFSLAFLSIAITQKKGSTVPPVAPLLILAVPIVDTVTIMTRRVMRGGSPFQADRYHLHHIIMRFGADGEKAVAIIMLLSLFFSGLAVTGTFLHMPEAYMFACFMAYAFTYFLSSFFIKHTFRFVLRMGKNRKPDRQTFRGRTAARLVDVIENLKLPRKSKRWYVDYHVLCRDCETGREYPGRVTNMSEGGFSVRFRESISLRNRMEVVIHPPDDAGTDGARFFARSVRMRDRGEFREYGFCFVDMDNAARVVLTGMLRRLKE